MNRFTFLVIVLILTVNIFAQSVQNQIYQDFISGNMTDWKKQMNTFAYRSNLSKSEKLELVLYYYGYIGYSLGIKNKKEAQIYIDKGDSLIDELINNNYALADAYALKGAFVGFKIGISPLKAPFIGKSSISAVNKALSIDPNNIQANIEKANILYYSPRAFGGDKEKAIKSYIKAVSLFESKSINLSQNWRYLNLLTNIGKIYSEMKKYDEAKRMFEKIMSIDRNYKYVKDELYPELLKKMR